MKRRYELMVVVAPTADMGSDKKRADLVDDVLKGQDSLSVEGVEDLGKKNLAYPIQKHGEATYLLATIAGDSVNIASMETRYRANDDILRYLVVRLEEKKTNGKKKEAGKKKE